MVIFSTSPLAAARRHTNESPGKQLQPLQLAFRVDVQYELYPHLHEVQAVQLDRPLLLAYLPDGQV